MQYLCYTMQAGDTVQGIAAAYQMGTDELVAANPQLFTQPVICPGVVITVPLRTGQCTAPGTVTPLPEPQPIPTWPPTETPNPLPEPIPWPTPQPEPIPWPTPQPEPGSGEYTELEDAVVELVNHERLRRRLPALVLNRALANVARTKSEDMSSNDYFSHTSPIYGSPFDMLRNFGFTYTSAGENIAKGQTTAQSVMNTWMGSSGHAANILNSAFTEIGVGYAYNNGIPIWTQIFIHP